MIIQKIFEGVFDEEGHSDFLKFGKGEFKNKYLVDAKRQADKWNVKTGAEFANFLVQRCLEKIEDEKIAVRGAIISTFDLSGEVDFDIVKKKNFQGVRQLVVDTEMEPKKILGLMEKYPRVFFALSFKTDNLELKIKPKAPKTAKAKKNEDGIKVDFCALKTKDADLVKELFFDVGLDWKEARVNHLIKIDDIIYPKNIPPEEMREKSKRKGILVREIVVDGKEVVREMDFEV